MVEPQVSKNKYYANINWCDGTRGVKNYFYVYLRYDST